MMAMSTLNVFIDGARAAKVSEESNRYQLTYFSGSSRALSISMPVRRRAYDDSTVRPFLAGFLPDDERERRALGREYGISPFDYIGLLGIVGLDCAGAIQFVASDELPVRVSTMEAVSIGAIGERLASLRSQHTESWVLREEHWSLGGAQEKFALHKSPNDGLWYSVTGEVPSTHILKPGVGSLRHQAFAEALTMRALELAGIAAAHTTYEDFDGENAVVSQRWDRIVSDGSVRRAGQEDICQAMSIMPDRKYESDGGPSVAEIGQFLRKQGVPQGSVVAFARALIANYLLCATDAHAKNYALHRDRSGALALAPLYDVASVYPYTSPNEKVRLAMKIGGENQHGHIEQRHWMRCADDLSVDPSVIIGDLHELATKMPDAVRDAFAQLSEERSSAGAPLDDDHARIYEETRARTEETCRKVRRAAESR